jgi:hypothetical protein
MDRKRVGAVRVAEVAERAELTPNRAPEARSGTRHIAGRDRQAPVRLMAAFSTPDDQPEPAAACAAATWLGMLPYQVK